MCLAIPGKLLDIDNNDGISRTGTVDFGGMRHRVSLACLPDVTVGQYVLVHVGMAISIVDEDEAQRVFQYLEEIESLDELDDMMESKKP